MNGIIFMKTNDLETVDDFYRKKLGCQLWLDQGACRIYKAGNFLLGFCQHLQTKIDENTLLTFFFEDRKEVDKFYEIMKDTAESSPNFNRKFQIYNFFAKDPEGRTLEFQIFENGEV